MDRVDQLSAFAGITSARNQEPDMTATNATQWVYVFGADKTDGNASMRNLLGGKGANLAEMASLGLPVPPGFTISTDVCTAYYANDRKFPDGLDAQVRTRLSG
jgi:pyruvate,orthophosphate dikinase